MEMNAYPLVSVIIVNYGNYLLSRALLDSLGKITYPHTEGILVDHDNQADELSKLAGSYPELKILQSGTNGGYASGINRGIQKAKGQYLLLLNNDLVVNPGFIEALVETFKKHPDAGIVSPKVLFAGTNKIQYAGTGRINPYTGRGFTKDYNLEDYEIPDKASVTNYAFGAAMMVPKALVKKIGGLPEIYFMYYEELDWSEKFKRAGYHIYCAGNAVVYHRDTPAPRHYSTLKSYYLFRNRILFLRRNYGLFQNIIAICYIITIVYTYKSFKGIFRGRFREFRACTKALWWHIKHPSVSTD